MVANGIINALEKVISHHENVSNKEWNVTLSKGTTIELLDAIKRKDEQINGLIAGQETLQKHLAEKNSEIERLKNAYKQCAWERDTFLEEMSKIPKANTSVSLIDGHIESDKAFWEDTN